LPTAKKAETIDELAELFSRSSVAVLTDYRGLSVKEITAMRRRLGESNVRYQVAKNTLTRFALAKNGRTGVADTLEGPTAIAFGFGDPSAAPKVLTDYIRANRSIVRIKGAILGDRLLDAQQVDDLAKLPSKAELQAQLLGALQGPMSGIVNAINQLLAGTVTVLQRRLDQLEEAA
jgi:large subunit ribosomal protein L10